MGKSPRAWYERYQSAVTRNGLSSSPHDSALFACHSSSEPVILLLYVDDMIITGLDTSDGSQVFLVNVVYLGILTPFRNNNLLDNYNINSMNSIMYLLLFVPVLKTSLSGENIKPNNQAYELFLFEFQYPVKFWTTNALVPIKSSYIVYSKMELQVFGLASELQP